MQVCDVCENKRAAYGLANLTGPDNIDQKIDVCESCWNRLLQLFKEWKNPPRAARQS